MVSTLAGVGWISHYSGWSRKARNFSVLNLGKTLQGLFCSFLAYRRMPHTRTLLQITAYQLSVSSLQKFEENLPFSKHDLSNRSFPVSQKDALSSVQIVFSCVALQGSNSSFDSRSLTAAIWCSCRTKKHERRATSFVSHVTSSDTQAAFPIRLPLPGRNSPLPCLHF